MKCPVHYTVSGSAPATAVFPSPDSPTGYAACFKFPAPQLERAWVAGDWMFSDQARSTRTDSGRCWPHQWTKELFPHTLLGLKSTPKELKDQTPGEEIDVSKFEFDWDILKLGMYEMDKGPDGVFTCTIPLPSGLFNYRFVTDMPEGNPLLTVSEPDPAAPPMVCEGEAALLSQLFVPFDETKQAEDRSIELPLPPEQRGTVSYHRYPTDPAFGAGAEQTCAVYLPKDYDEWKEYPVLYLSHGGGDGLSAWINQGAMPNILDHLIADGTIPPTVVVLMANEIFHWNNQEKTIPNLTDHLMPWVERQFHVSRSAGGRAFAGLSAGGMLAFEVLESVGDRFGAVGVWSGGQRFEADLTKDFLKNVRIHIGAGYYDDARFAFGEPLEAALTAHGVPFTSLYPLGGHQWSVWRKLLEDFLTRVFPVSRP